MRVLVTYYSDTGNTEKLARAIYEALPVNRELLPVREVQDTSGFDLMFCGFPVHAHSVPQVSAKFIKTLPEGQNILFFSTHGSRRGGQLPRQALEHAVGLAVKQKILGHFGCQGQVSESIMSMLRNKLEHHAWVEEAEEAAGHPNINDLDEAKKFTSEMLKKFREKKSGGK
jgi:flavodoxin I